MNIFRSVALLGSWTFVSRILGFIRDILITKLFGTSYVVDSFIIAFRLPNLFRRLFAEGALNAAFVPIYAEVFHKDGLRDAQIFAGKIFIFFGVSMFILCTVIIIFASDVVAIVAPGFVDKPDVFEKAVLLSQICFFYLFFMSMVAIAGGILNSHRKFFAGAFTPIFLNIMMIIVLLAMDWFFLSLRIEYLAWAVLVSGFVQLFFMIFMLYRKTLLPVFSVIGGDAYSRKFFTLMAPGILSYGLLQINSLVGDIIASTTGESSISWLFFADRLVQLPIGLLGVSVSVSLLPSLTQYVQDKKNDDVKKVFEQSLVLVMALGIPACLGLFFLAEYWIFFLFERGEFSAHDTSQTAKVLKVFALSIPLWLVVKTLSPMFFARQDTKFPMKITLLSVFINACLAWILKEYYGFVAIAYASVVAAFITMVGLILGLIYKHQWRFFAVRKMMKICIFQIPSILFLLLCIEIMELVKTSAGKFFILSIVTMCVAMWSYFICYYTKILPPLTKLLQR